MVRRILIKRANEVETEMLAETGVKEDVRKLHGRHGCEARTCTRKYWLRNTSASRNSWRR